MPTSFPHKGNAWGSCGHVCGRRGKVDRTAIPRREGREGNASGREGRRNASDPVEVGSVCLFVTAANISLGVMAWSYCGRKRRLAALALL